MDGVGGGQGLHRGRRGEAAEGRQVRFHPSDRARRIFDLGAKTKYHADRSANSIITTVNINTRDFFLYLIDFLLEISPNSQILSISSFTFSSGATS